MSCIIRECCALETPVAALVSLFAGLLIRQNQVASHIFDAAASPVDAPLPLAHAAYDGGDGFGLSGFPRCRHSASSISRPFFGLPYTESLFLLLYVALNTPASVDDCTLPVLSCPCREPPSWLCCDKLILPLGSLFSIPFLLPMYCTSTCRNAVPALLKFGFHNIDAV